MKQLLILVCICLLLASPVFAQTKKSKTDRPKVGLVLGGGGAKGAAEIGVLKYIEEAGIPIDYIAGTSIGSIIGGLYSVGYRSEDLDSLFHNEEWLDLFSDRNAKFANRLYTVADGVAYVFGVPLSHRRSSDTEDADSTDHRTRTVGLLHGDNIVALLDSMTGRLGDVNFNHLPIPFHCVAVDIRKFREVELSSGSLPVAMRSSMAIPAVFKPVERDSMLLVDGGLLNNLPVDVVKRMGADVVIAIDLTQNKHDDDDVSEDYDMAEGNTLRRLYNWITKRPDLKKYNANRRAATVYINPALTGFSAASFKAEKIDEMIRQGEIAGKKAQKKLKALKKKLKK